MLNIDDQTTTHHGPLGRQLLDDERGQEHAREHERSVDRRQRVRPEALDLKSFMALVESWPVRREHAADSVKALSSSFKINQTATLFIYCRL